MSVVGIDVSTFGYDVVVLSDEDNCPPEWLSWRAPGRTAAERLTHLRGLLPTGSWWDGVSLVGIERPAGAPNIEVCGALHLAVGIAVSAIPSTLHPWLLRPAAWRSAIGLSPTCNKATVAEWARENGALDHWAQDAYDALAIAHAVRTQQDTNP